MSTGTQRNIQIKASPTDPTVYTVSTIRDTDSYALDSGGVTAMQTAIKTGQYPFPLTVEDNGAIIAANTVPPTIKPTASALLAPTSLNATAASSSVINLTWGAVAGATSYEVERSANGTTGWSQIATPSTASYSNTGLSTNTSYYYRVRAVNSSATSGYSSTANATTSGASYAAYSQTQTYTGDTEVHPDLGSGATTRDLAFTDAPKSDTNYNFSGTIQTNLDTGTATGRIKVNGVSQQTFNVEGASGGTRPISGTLSLQAGSNTITFEYVSGINYTPRSLTITRAAGA